ncbi:MAG: FAD:protein FMN transferase [Saprospiraceae bacterium]|nr:FAD:protein FMN transferase [Saprospiraceae bacterium]
MKLSFTTGLGFLVLALLGCSAEKGGTYQQIIGETMGTYYQITYQPVRSEVGQSQIDHLLRRLNQALSTYDSTSVISLFNHSPRGIRMSDINDSELANYFYDNLELSQEIYRSSKGGFDPTVMPLVNYWGFGYTPRNLTQIDTTMVDSIKSIVGLEKVNITLNTDAWVVEKTDGRTQLDFSAVAKGYAIDVIGAYLRDSFGISNYLVDIGGESSALGVNRSGQSWRVAINRPLEASATSSFDFVVQLKNKSIATSGNYRNYYEIDGEKISHTINPHSGFFERNDLLSASILAEECAMADACATACMTLGYEGAKEFISRNKGLSAVLLYLDQEQQIKHYLTPDLKINEQGLITEDGI